MTEPSPAPARRRRAKPLSRMPAAGPHALLGDTQPRYASVGTALAAEIMEGHRPVGALLPSEQELAQAFGVSRATVREALRRLRELGLVAAMQGVGTRVVASRPRATYELALRSTAEVMGYADRTTLRIDAREPVVLDPEQADRLGAVAGEEMLMLSGVRLRAAGDRQPMSCVELYLPAIYAAVARRPEVGEVPLYRLMERHLGLRLGEIRQEITAVALDAAQAATLGVAPGAPGLRILRRFYGLQRQLLEVTVNVHPAGDRFAYAIRLAAPDVAMPEERPAKG